MRAGNPRVIRKIHADSFSVALDPYDLDVRVCDDTLGGKSLGKAGCEFGIVAGKQRTDIEHRDLRTEPGVRLRHFYPDRSAADHNQMLWQLAVGEDRFIGHVG